ncbi:MAG TPA: hypothetical protein VEL31_04895 [Ktedonobacteraceae bacterium]|nr:hypothetical protein [Ktedonobacteraceae bacterium]
MDILLIIQELFGTDIPENQSIYAIIKQVYQKGIQNTILYRKGEADGDRASTNHDRGRILSTMTMSRNSVV